MKLATLALFLLAACCSAQTPSFEVASVKLFTGERTGPPVRISPDSLTIHGLSLQDCIQNAWQTPDERISAPGWLRDIRLQIEAKTAAPVEEKQLWVMLQRLLAERLGVTVHREPREAAVLVLTVAKDGPKFHESTTEGPTAMRSAKGLLTGEHVLMSEFSIMLGKGFGRNVVDETGLKGRYDFRLDMSPYLTQAPGDAPPDPASVLRHLLPEQAGLKVDSRKQNVEFLVIDHAEKTPTEN